MEIILKCVTLYDEILDERRREFVIESNGTTYYGVLCFPLEGFNNIVNVHETLTYNTSEGVSVLTSIVDKLKEWGIIQNPAAEQCFYYWQFMQGVTKIIV